MQVSRIHSKTKVFAQLLCLGLPTLLLAGYFLRFANNFYTILENDFIKQTIYFGVGLVAAFIFYAYRFRFVTTTLVLFLVFSTIHFILQRLAFGEFNAFFASVHFLIFSILFLFGWITGYGLSRSIFYTIAWPVFLCGIQIFFVGKTTDITATKLIIAFAPVLFYTLFIIYTAMLIRNVDEDKQKLKWFISGRVLGFLLLVCLALAGILYYFQPQFKAIEKEWTARAKAKEGKGGGQSQTSMTTTNKDGSVSNANSTSLTSSLSKNQKLIFVARLDNYFPDSITPNPLYFTSSYYTKFDTAIQAFEIDPKMPDNDLFKPDPSTIPLYFARTDSTVIKNSHATKDRKIVQAEVYAVLLSPNEFIAPATAFYCQPIPVPPAFKDVYKSAYRAKMWVSDLNSAYFIYNPANNPALEDFQQERFERLRSVTSYAGVPKSFLDYYTDMPSDPDYDSIRTLATTLTQHAHTPIDKVLAIRDYFLSKDEFGQPLFAYSDNPGIPGLPSASKLNYFLFQNRKGYCAYYAGATLFMLRALHIPSRVAAGYLTVDRSSKNPGWYWFYQNQSHAWVQVFFPGYGWIDFDTTIPDVNTQQSPQPDGTPPLNMQQPFLVADGNIQSIDTTKKLLTLSVNKLLFHDKDYASPVSVPILLDISLATISRDTGVVNIQALQRNMHITAASYAEALKNSMAAPNDSIAGIFSKLNKPVPIDEIKIVVAAAKNDKTAGETVEKKSGKLNLLKIAIIFLLACLLVLLLSPSLIWQYYHTKVRTSTTHPEQPFFVHRALSFYLHQLGYQRKAISPHSFATKLDEALDTNITSFSDLYQKWKYSNTRLSDAEFNSIKPFYEQSIQQIKRKIPLKKRILAFIHINRTFHYFKNPKISSYESE